VTSEVSGVNISFDARRLGEILWIPSMGFDLYVREDKTMLGRAKLLELAQTLSRNRELKHPQPMKKGEMDSIHRLLFWFIIKNVIPRGQGRNQGDAMNQCFTDLMYKGEQINLPAIIIKHIARIADTTREHDLGYGFLLTQVFEFFGIELKKRVEARSLMRLAAAPSWGVVIHWFRAQFVGQNRWHEHLLLLFLMAPPAGLL